MTMDIIKPGMLTTVQDMGRFGLQQYGVIVSGAMDQMSYRIANILLQQEDKAVLEFTLIGPTIVFSQPTVIALTGANFQPQVNGLPCPMWRPVTIKAGDELKLKAAGNGARGYLAVQGGIQVTQTLHSRSTYLRAGIGGYQGRALQKGDVLPYIPNQQLPGKHKWFVDYTTFLEFEQHLKIRVIHGAEFASFDSNSQERFTEIVYRLTNDADRMGYRLDGENNTLTRTENSDLLSEAVTFGTIQVPPNGQPIILMADRQTTGGYPKIAQVVTVDLPKLAQLRPNQTLQFEWITLQEAQRLLIEREMLLAQIQMSIAWKVN